MKLTPDCSKLIKSIAQPRESWRVKLEAVVGFPLKNFGGLDVLFKLIETK